jgi:hypothetical protein
VNSTVCLKSWASVIMYDLRLSYSQRMIRAATAEIFAPGVLRSCLASSF